MRFCPKLIPRITVKDGDYRKWLGKYEKKRYIIDSLCPLPVIVQTFDYGSKTEKLVWLSRVIWEDQAIEISDACIFHEFYVVGLMPKIDNMSKLSDLPAPYVNYITCDDLLVFAGNMRYFWDRQFIIDTNHIQLVKDNISFKNRKIIQSVAE